jgi:RND family efflux transporter MFP subunit
MLALLGLAFSAVAQVPVRTVLPEQAEIAPQRRLSGSLIALQDAELSLQQAGVVVSIAVEPGSSVRRGDELLRLDDQLARLEAARDAASLAEGRARAQEAQRVADERRVLAEQRNLPRTQAEAAAAEAAIAAVAVSRLEAELRLQQAVVDRHRLNAPFDGVIRARHVDLGEWVQPGDAVLDLVSNAELRFEVYAPQELWGRLQPGDRAELRFDRLPDRRLEGEIEARVAAQDRASRSFLLRLRLLEPDALLTAGMSGEAVFTAGEGQTQWTLPRDALLRYPDGSVGIWLAEATPEGHVARARRIEPGAELGTRIAVQAGIDGGERVVLHGNERLRDGEPLKLLDE